MDKPKKWLEKLNNICLHERVVFFSLSLVLLILTFDSWLKNLPISGYALILIILILIGCTTWGTCHGIKWLLHCNKPLRFYIVEKSQNEKFHKILNFIFKKDDVFDRIFKSKEDAFMPFKYPTTLNEQVRLFLKDTEKDFVKPWYSEISQNPSFLFDTHLLLEEILLKIIERFKKVKYKNLILNILMLYLDHLQKYKKSVRKVNKGKNLNGNERSNKGSNCDEARSTDAEIVDLYRYTHPGSQSDQIADYYLMKVVKWILHEYAPQEFVISLQCKILIGILSKKILKTSVTTAEDPIWIYIKLINLLDNSKCEEILNGRVYVVEKKIVKDANDAKEYKLKKPLIITKRYMKSNLFGETSNLFNKTCLNENKMKVPKPETSDKSRRRTTTTTTTERESINLQLQCNNNDNNLNNTVYDGFLDGEGSHISSVLGGIISSTAGPLLPENVSLCYEPLNKMWQSPVTEKAKDFSDPMGLSVGKTVVEGVKIERKQSIKNKCLSRSKSTDSMSVDGSDSLKFKDVSIGEELCENVRFASNEDMVIVDVEEENNPKLKSHNGAVKKLVKTRSFDIGSFPSENDSDDSPFEKKPGEQESSGTLNVDETSKEHGNVSPVYEEPEDFATTIAKLRSLLQQRESTSTLSDKSVPSLDFPSNASFTEASDSSNKTQSTDLENSSFDSQGGPEIPTDGRPFLNICINRTETGTDSNGSTCLFYLIQYDGIYKLKDQNSSEEPELVLQTTVVKRSFQDFMDLQNRLEDNINLKTVLKGVKGSSGWLKLASCTKTDELYKMKALEAFLRNLCSKLEICALSELHEFLAYGSSGNKTFLKKDSESSIKRIDKLLTDKVSDVFNTIKTALPSFDFDSTNSISSGDNNVKASQEQKLLPGFLNFGNKTEEFEINFEYDYKESTGDSLIDDIRRYLSEKSDGVENAMDVLDSNDWLAEKRECRPISSEGQCVWHNYKDLLDEDMDQLDSWLPVYSVILDVLCELLEESDSWLIKEPVIRLIKVLTGHWEKEIQERLLKLDWDQITGNIIRLLRGVIFQTPAALNAESAVLDKENLKVILKDLILGKMPNWLAQFIKIHEMSSAVSLFIDSFQYFEMNRDLVLRLVDILLVQFLSCHHLTCDSS